MEGDHIGTDGNDSDVSISFVEPPKQHVQLQSSADDGDEEEELSTPKETGDSDDLITNLHLEIDGLRLERSDLQQSLASLTADYKSELSRMQQALSQMSSEAHNARTEADMTKKALEEQKNDLEDRVRYLEGRMLDLEMKNELEATNFLKKNGELMMVVEELKSKAEDSRISFMSKENEVNALTEALNMCKQQAEVVAKENEAKDKVIASLTEELRIKREKGIDILEMEKKFGAVMTKKEDEIMSLKKDLILAKENQEFKNKVLEEELKLLNDDVSNLERTKKLLSGLTAAAIMTSIGTVTATITIFYLRRNKQE